MVSIPALDVVNRIQDSPSKNYNMMNTSIMKIMPQFHGMSTIKLALEDSDLLNYCSVTNRQVNFQPVDLYTLYPDNLDQFGFAKSQSPNTSNIQFHQSCLLICFK